MGSISDFLLIGGLFVKKIALFLLLQVGFSCMALSHREKVFLASSLSGSRAHLAVLDDVELAHSLVALSDSECVEACGPQGSQSSGRECNTNKINNSKMVLVKEKGSCFRMYTFMRCERKKTPPFLVKSSTGAVRDGAKDELCNRQSNVCVRSLKKVCRPMVKPVVEHAPCQEHQCDYPGCGKTLPSLETLKLHKRLRHEQVKVAYMCGRESCTCHFSSAEALRQHELEVHNRC
jgi:hypothetical protein